MALLITHSLLSSWLYAVGSKMDAEDPWKEFLTVLRREPTPVSEAAQKGIDFEDLAVAIAKGGDVPDGAWGTAAAEVAGMIRGGIYQYKAMRAETIGGIDFLLYGRLDVLKAGQIMDIKYTGSYERGKFYGSTQHPFYLTLVPEADEFSYLITNGAEVWTETYRRDEMADIRPTILWFVDWLKETELWGEYEKWWQART